MKEAYRYDNTGKYIEPVLVYPNEKGGYDLPENCTFEQAPQPNWKPVFMNGKWIETASVDEINRITGNTLETIRNKKIREFDSLCESTILGNFKATINNIEYSFSNDSKAQSRLNGVAVSFVRGYITEIEWTAYLNNERTSLVLTEAQFDIVAKAALTHTNGNIEKFRNKVSEISLAQSVEEINGIHWDTL